MKKYEYQSKNKHLTASVVFYSFSETKENLKQNLKRIKLSWPVKFKIKKIKKKCCIVYKKHTAFFCLKRVEDLDIQELQLKKDNKRKSSIKNWHNTKRKILCII